MLTGIHADLLRYDNGVDTEAIDLSTQQADKVAEALIRASQTTGISLAWLVAFARIESNFNPRATNGSSRGLFQMQEAAWTEAAEVVSLPQYTAGWMDPVANALAAAAYIRLNLRQLSHYGLNAEVEPRWIYLAHQQGAAGLNELVRLSRGENVSTHFVTDKKMRRNVAPGSKATTDRVEFYRNWMLHLANYFDGNPFD
jgi:soluble lytic murein transglycosylase-like protein